MAEEKGAENMTDGIDAKSTGTEIKIRRIRSRITQKELAEALGVSQTHLSNVENGRSMLV